MDSAAAPHSRLLARNAVLNLVGQGAPLVVAVLAMPQVIRGLGPERYGILSMAWIVLGYFGIFDLGLGRAATRFVASALGSGSEESVPTIAWTAVLVQTALGVLGALVLAATTPLLANRILNIPPGLGDEARSSFYVLALSIPAVLVSGSFRGVLEAAQRFDLVNVAAAPLSAANFLLPLVGISLGWKLPGIVGLLVASRALGAVVFFLLCTTVFPSLQCAPRFGATEARRLLGFGSWVTISSIVGPILVYVDRFMIGVLLTMAAVAYYAAPYEMVTRLLIVPVSVVATLFPAFSRFDGERQGRTPTKLLGRSVKYLLLVLGPPVVILLGFSRDILQVWLGPAFAQNSAAAVQVLAVGVLANSLAQLPFALIQASGRPDVTAKIHLLELPLQIILAWACVSWWGITGAALAWSLRSGIDALLLFLAACRLNSISARPFIDLRIPQAFGLVALLGSLAASSSALIHEGRLRLWVLLLSSSVAAIVMWRHVLDEDERGQIIRLLAVAKAR